MVEHFEISNEFEYERNRTAKFHLFTQDLKRK